LTLRIGDNKIMLIAGNHKFSMLSLNFQSLAFFKRNLSTIQHRL
jgi:hypothetical protein